MRVGLGRTGWSKSGKQTTGSNGLTSQFIYNVTLECENQDHEDDPDDSDEDDELITRQLHVTESRRNHGDFTTC